MKYNIPQKLSQEEYDSHIYQKLNDPKVQSYRNLFKRGYTVSPETGERTLKDTLSDDELAKMDFVLKRIGYSQFATIKEVAEYFRMLLQEKKYIFLFAYNGTGKTRLSVEFKLLGQQTAESTGQKLADTLYYNAFTEDLFYWDNDLHNGTDRFLKLNSDSKFFAGLEDLAMENRIRPLLHRYADFDFSIDYESWSISFSREILVDGAARRVDNIKISRGEENTFIWCFFLAIAQLAIDKEESYKWVKYIYIDDPISSLDDNNVIAVASHLAQLIRNEDIKVIVSSHHALFYNVLCNEITKPEQLFFQKDSAHGAYVLRDTQKTPFFQHVALLKELKHTADSGELYTYHFNILRNILEKTASFHGYAQFSSCIKSWAKDDEAIYTRTVNLLSHGNYSIFEPKEMVEDNKELFKTILKHLIDEYNFNPGLFAAD